MPRPKTPATVTITQVELNVSDVKHTVVVDEMTCEGVRRAMADLVMRHFLNFPGVRSAEGQCPDGCPNDSYYRRWRAIADSVIVKESQCFPFPNKREAHQRYFTECIWMNSLYPLTIGDGEEQRMRPFFMLCVTFDTTLPVATLDYESLSGAEKRRLKLLVTRKPKNPEPLL